MQKFILIFGITALFTACKNNNTASESSEPTSVVADIKEAVTNDGLKSAI